MQTRTDQAGLTVLKRRNLLVWTIRPHQDSLLIGSETLLLCATCIWRLDLRRNLSDQSKCYQFTAISN